ncbi:unnamed protein product, partial [Ixodes hexagonus]
RRTEVTPLFEPPAMIARRLGDEYGDFLPAAEELERRYQLMGKQLAQYGSPFDAECTSSRTSPCWLLDHQDAWNIAINRGGMELRCHKPDRLFLSMVPLSLNVTPTMRLVTTASTLLAALWLLNNHHCIEYVTVNADIVFGPLSQPFFTLVRFRAPVRHLQVMAWLPFDETKDNDDMFSLSFADIRSLESITLSGMALSDFATSNIAEALSWNDSHLTYVSLRAIHVLRDSLEALLSALHECRRIRTLDLGVESDCPGLLKPLEDLLESNRDLEEFRYELNGPVRFPFHTLFQNRTLKTLCVGKKLFDVDDIKDLANTLTRNKRLRLLGLSLCPLEDHRALWCIFAAGIANNVALRELDMQRSDITDVAASLFSEALKINKTLEKLNVATGKLPASAAKLLAESLLTNTSLQELRIGRVQGESEDLTGLFDILQDPRASRRVYRFYSVNQLPTLIKLTRQRCQQSEVQISGTDPVPQELASHFFFAIRMQKHLTKLNITLNTSLQPHCARYLASLIRKSVTLTDVDLCFETKSPEIIVLSEGIRQSSSVHRLEIGSWMFDVQSADAFIEMLKNSRSISHVTIFRSNEGTDDVIVRLGEALEDNHGLFGIDLFDAKNLQITCFPFLSELRRNYFRLTRAAAFFQGVLCDQESADDFRKLALSEALLERLGEDRESSEEEIKAAITERLARLSL